MINLLNAPKNLKRLLKSGKLTVAVYGLGYVGASIVAVWLRAGAGVIGVDKSDIVITRAAKGMISTEEKTINDALKRGIREKRFQATNDGVLASRLSDFKIVAVPVMLRDGRADLSNLVDVSEKIAQGIKKGDVVSVSPTVPPGTTENLVLTTIEKTSGLKADIDFGLIYSPERIYIGRAVDDIEKNYPSIVSGVGTRSLNVAVSLYSLVSKKGVIKMGSVKAAEIEKIMEGVYRDVNIALANELAKICDTLGIDYWEARKAANSQPFCSLHKPGSGVGGACIPVYPRFLIEVAARAKASSSITTLAREINSLMPGYCVGQALSLLGRTGKQPTNSKVAVLGLAFRGGVSDTRLSPSYDIVKELLNAGCRVTVHDPYVSSDNKLPRSVFLTKKLGEALDDSDLVIIATDHKQYAKIDSRKLGKAAIYDGRGIIDGTKFSNMLFAGIGCTKK